ncbi:MAG: class I adenylate-forming enzyme family protein, partial [Pseudomonadota bacterium]|nr:class I adenylate-forming enzyme family protein [Pseudomonadota bacterium]
PPATLGDLVRERAETLGDQVAADWFQDDRRLTYRALHEQADRLASTLLPIGVRKGSHVAVMLPNIPETMITWTAIGRLGAVMVPINTRYTATELAYVLNDSDAQYLVIEESYLSVLEAMAERPAMIADSNIIVVGAAAGERHHWSALVAQGGHPFEPPVEVTGSDLLNIQYTSGTTGFPKGCMLSHDYWIRTGYSLAVTRGDDHSIRNVLVWAPFFYMDGMWQILSSFFLDATAYVARRMSMTSFLDLLRDYQIHACAFPELALKAHPPSPADDELVLEYVYAFGWRPESKRAAEARFGFRARDGYGMTELGTATITPIAAGEKNFERTCGLAILDRQLKVMDEAGVEVARGETGELWVTGPGILWGYYKRPAANAEAFRGAWFCTGDIVRQDEAGYFFIVGRMKEMVKRSGENVAAREVEAVLNEIDTIAESAVIPVPDEKRGEEVKACIRLPEGVSPDDIPPQAILDHCKQHLAVFKLPRYIAYMDGDFPRTPTGKVAKQRLIAAATDLRVGTYDVVDDIWR